MYRNHETSQGLRNFKSFELGHKKNQGQRNPKEAPLMHLQRRISFGDLVEDKEGRKRMTHKTCHRQFVPGTTSLEDKQPVSVSNFQKETPSVPCFSISDRPSLLHFNCPRHQGKKLGYRKTVNLVSSWKVHPQS